MIKSTPAGEVTVTKAIDAFDHDGFTEHFGVRGGRLVALDTGERFEASDVVIRRVDRFEGVSDPDDMTVVYAIESRSGVRGTLTDAFGVYSSPAVSDFVRQVECCIENGRG